MLAVTAVPACGHVGTDPNQIVALEVVLPDSGRIEVTDTLRPRARALNGRGDSVAAAVVWASLDTAVLVVVDSTTGVAYAQTVGTGRLQARVGTFRSDLQNIFVLPALTSAQAAGPTRDIVTLSAPDSISDSLLVQVSAPVAGTDPLRSRRVVYAATVYPAGVATVRFVPGDTVKTGATGIAADQLRFTAGVAPDSVVVFATLRRPDGTPVPGTPVKFVVEFRP